MFGADDIQQMPKFVLHVALDLDCPTNLRTHRFREADSTAVYGDLESAYGHSVCLTQSGVVGVPDVAYEQRRETGKELLFSRAGVLLLQQRLGNADDLLRPIPIKLFLRSWREGVRLVMNLSIIELYQGNTAASFDGMGPVMLVPHEVLKALDEKRPKTATLTFQPAQSSLLDERHEEVLNQILTFLRGTTATARERIERPPVVLIEPRQCYFGMGRIRGVNLKDVRPAGGTKPRAAFPRWITADNHERRFTGVRRAAQERERGCRVGKRADGCICADFGSWRGCRTTATGPMGPLALIPSDH